MKYYFTAKRRKENDEIYQTAQRYHNQGMIPLVQMMDNMLKGKEAENFKLTKDASRLPADAHSDMSNLRRCLKTAVAEKYWPAMTRLI